MKRKNIHLLIATTLLLAACSDAEQSLTGQMPIELQAAGEGLTSKANAAIAQAFATTVVATTASGNYTAPTWSQGATVQASGAVQWERVPNYPESGKIHLVAVSPAATESVGGTAGTVAYTLDGQTDLLYAAQISGSKTDGERFSGNTDGKVTPLTYAHLLTQLKFKATYSGTGSVKVKSLSIKATPTATVALATGEATFSGDETEMKRDFTNEGITVESSKSTDLGALLLPPLTGQAVYKVTVATLDKTYEDLDITFTSSDATTPAFAAGTSCEITLKFADPVDDKTELGITSVTVATWTTTPSGDLDLIQ